MTERAIAFVENWVSENIRAEGYDAVETLSRAKVFAGRCLEAANAAGIPQTEITEAFVDLKGSMAGEIQEAINRAAPRLGREL